MPRVTKEMLEERIRFLHEIERMKDHKIELLEKEVGLLKSPNTAHGQLSVLVIALERVTDAVAHVLGDLKRKP